MALRLTAAIAAMMVSGAAFSAVTVTAPEEIKIVAVNDQEVSAGLLRSNQQYKLDAGENAISVRYTEFFQHADNSHDILRSGIVTVKTPELKDGENYRLALIDAPKDFDAAQKYKDQPIIGLYDQQKQLLVKQAGAKAEQKAWFSTGAFGSSSVDLTKTRTAAPASQPAPVYAQAVSVSGAEASVRAGTADQQLVQLWQKSSKQERQKFMSWLAEQAN
ncbi:MAG: DUF2057 family protein [Acinetobacter sp.]|nr:DUF2057 family protein [Acinetobacter sp.]